MFNFSCSPCIDQFGSLLARKNYPCGYCCSNVLISVFIVEHFLDRGLARRGFDTKFSLNTLLHLLAISLNTPLNTLLGSVTYKSHNSFSTSILLLTTLESLTYCCKHIQVLDTLSKPFPVPEIHQHRPTPPPSLLSRIHCGLSKGLLPTQVLDTLLHSFLPVSSTTSTTFLTRENVPSSNISKPETQKCPPNTFSFLLRAPKTTLCFPMSIGTLV